MLIFFTLQKSAKRLEQKWSSHTAPPLVTRGGYIVVCRTNRFIRIPPLKLYENGNLDLTITHLMLYTLNFEAYLGKLHIAPSSLGLSCYGERLVVIACVQWNSDVTEKLNKFHKCCDCLMLFAVPEHPGLYISSTYHEVTEYQIWFLFVKGLVGYNIFLDDKSLIPKSLACHLKQTGFQDVLEDTHNVALI